MRSSNIWFEQWCSDYFEGRDLTGIEPLFDPLEVFSTGNEHMIEELKQKGIDANFCQYKDPRSGCMIPQEKRPNHCGEFPATKGEN